MQVFARQRSGVVDVHTAGKIVLLLLIDSAENESVFLHQDGDASGWNDQHAGAVVDTRSRGRVAVTVDRRGTARSAAERPLLDLETSD